MPGMPLVLKNFTQLIGFINQTNYQKKLKEFLFSQFLICLSLGILGISILKFESNCICLFVTLSRLSRCTYFYEMCHGGTLILEDYLCVSWLSQYRDNQLTHRRCRRQKLIGYINFIKAANVQFLNTNIVCEVAAPLQLSPFITAQAPQLVAILVSLLGSIIFFEMRLI